MTKALNPSAPDAPNGRTADFEKRLDETETSQNVVDGVKIRASVFIS